MITKDIFNKLSDEQKWEWYNTIQIQHENLLKEYYKPSVLTKIKTFLWRLR